MNAIMQSDVAVVEPAMGTWVPTVLLVDDEPHILSALKRVLRLEPCLVVTAGSGEEALGILARQPIALVLSDMRMPGMSGAELLAEARRCQPDTIRVLLTGYADMQSTVQAINEGNIYRYIAKPWNDGEIVGVVRDVLETYRLRRETERLTALTQAQNKQLAALNAELEDRVAARTEALEKTAHSLEQANDKLKRNYLTSVKVFSNLIALRSGHLAGNAQAVAPLARKLAQGLGLSDREANDVFLAGLLRDIGKIGLPDALLTKPFLSLLPEEREKVTRHPLKGQAALMSLDHLSVPALFIRNQHERYDGLGFPDSLSGVSIPLGARILAVANDYLGLQSGAVQEKVLSADEALLTMRHGAGKRYDPAVVDALFALCDAEHDKRMPESVSLRPAALKPGMTLAQDLRTRDGVLLLSSEHVLDERIIAQIQSYEESDRHPLQIAVWPAVSGPIIED